MQTEKSWKKSTRSEQTGQCVEVALMQEAVYVRDSKVIDGPELEFAPEAWASFVSAVKAGQLG